MQELATEKVRATAQDLIEVLGAYEDELDALAAECPQVAALREALGAALAEACRCILDWDADGSGRTTH
jgi:hypothetical protein